MSHVGGRKQYSAERMNLVILGGESLDTLEEWTRDLFCGVSGGAGPRPAFPDIGPPYQVPLLCINNSRGIERDRAERDITYVP
jgi:secreted Zn-dependent insulinase-like peptidase